MIGLMRPLTLGVGESNQGLSMVGGTSVVYVGDGILLFVRYGSGQ